MHTSILLVAVLSSGSPVVYAPYHAAPSYQGATGTSYVSAYRGVTYVSPPVYYYASAYGYSTPTYQPASSPTYYPTSYSAPVYSAPTYHAPVSYSAPSYYAPAYSSPSYYAPSYGAPAYSYAPRSGRGC